MRVSTTLPAAKEDVGTRIRGHDSEGKRPDTCTCDGNMQFHLIHPGVALKEELGARGITLEAAALKLRVPPQHVQGIVRGDQPITPDTALRLSRFLGTSAEFWMALQTNHDLEAARKERGARIEAAA